MGIPGVARAGQALWRCLCMRSSGLTIFSPSRIAMLGMKRMAATIAIGGVDLPLTPIIIAPAKIKRKAVNQRAHPCPRITK